MSSLNGANPHWWIQPDPVEQVDSFTGLEPLYLTEVMAVIPFPKYGWWWLLHYINDVYVYTHGPFSDEEAARIHGYCLVE